MSEDDERSEGLRDRLSARGEDAIGEIADALLDNPYFNGALQAAFGAREKALDAQRAAMGALNLPSADDIERLNRRVRSLSQRLEEIEDAMDRLEDRIGAGDPPSIAAED